MPVRVTLLATPALPLLVDSQVFDAFAWSPGGVCEWRAPADRAFEINALDAELPLRLAFVMRTPWDALPMELARLHTGRGYELQDEMALAPYGIDDATDQLFEHRRSADTVFWMAADNLNALFWGLHDWVHFHNHGEFTERTATELQCDVSALAWLWLNRDAIPLADDAWNELREQVCAIHRQRCASDPPGCPLDASILYDPARLRALADALPRGTRATGP